MKTLSIFIASLLLFTSCTHLPVSLERKPNSDFACQQNFTFPSEEENKKWLSEPTNLNIKNMGVFAKPVHLTTTMIKYEFSEHRKLNPGEAFYFAIPKELAGRKVHYLILGHKQNPSYEKGFNEQTQYDDIPGKTSVQVHAGNSSLNDNWYYWGGMSSGSQGAKYAAIGSSLELENLYEWNKNGAYHVTTNQRSNLVPEINMIRLLSMGQDPVEIGEITLKTRPNIAGEYQTTVFSEGTAFDDPQTLKGQKFGGGQAFKGLFPNALELRYSSEQNANLPSDWKHQGTQLAIPIPKGKKLISVEFALGDSHSDQQQNNDGGWGKQGWGKLNVKVQDKQSSEILMNYENIPPEGVLLAATNCTPVSEGDQYLMIDAPADTVYIMAIRLGFE